ncbi:hypothetical protein ACT3CE_05400 [Marinifilum sp. RC60d5]|uniref:hypothetical protein n=1 Tax=Marinifilum sp. RC60d5 TaxID=3458414 RepID=UPI004036006A
MRFSFVLILIVFTSFNLAAQSVLADFEVMANTKFEQLQLANSDSLKLEICKSLEDSFFDVLSHEESFLYPFSKLDKMGKLTSPDNLFRIYNWNCVLSDGTYRYFGLIQIADKSNCKLIKLSDNRANANMFTSYKANNWPGALYYKIIPFKSEKVNSYLLLAWDGNTISSNKKLIEVLSINKNGEVQFGKPVILWRGKLLNRVVFEYAKQAQMTIQYQKKKKRLVFDHLAPSLPNYKNQFEYYGPDFSYDALILKKGIWKLNENIDPVNK